MSIIFAHIDGQAFIYLLVCMYMCVNELNDRKYDAVYPRSNKRLYNTSYGGC